MTEAVASAYSWAMQALRVLLLLLAGALCSCAHLKKDQTVCSEYRNLRCVNGPVCSMDQQRGCRVCHCEKMNEMQDGNPDDNWRPSE